MHCLTHGCPQYTALLVAAVSPRCSPELNISSPLRLSDDWGHRPTPSPPPPTPHLAPASTAATTSWRSAPPRRVSSAGRRTHSTLILSAAQLHGLQAFFSHRRSSMDVPVLAYLAASGHMPRHVVQHWKREVWKPREPLLILIVLSAYLTPAADSASNLRPEDPVPPAPDLGGSDSHVSAAVALGSFVGVGVAGAAVPIMQLCRLWLLRLIAAALVNILESMPLESRTRSWRLRAFIGAVAIWLTCMAATAAADSVACIFVAVLELACHWAGLRSAGSFAPLGPEKTVLPLKALVQLEAITTCATAWSIVVRVEPLLSARVTVPSPSHAPSLDRSAFFTAIKNFFTGPAGARTARRHQDRQRRLARRRRQARAMRQHASPSLAENAAERTSVAAAQVPTQQHRHDAAVHPLPPAPPAPQRQGTVPAGPPEMMAEPAEKPPREAGHAVQLELLWASDVLLALINRSMAAVQYTVVLAALPHVTFASVVAVLALHQQASIVVDTWSDARTAAECLEFVLRRWPGPQSRPKPSTCLSRAVSQHAEEVDQD